MRCQREGCHTRQTAGELIFIRNLAPLRKTISPYTGFESSQVGARVRGWVRELLFARVKGLRPFDRVIETSYH